jgi:hypothetical protein
MPQFDASGVVEGLECKLKPYADFDGLIPEPTDQQIGEFLAGLKKVMKEARDKLGLAEEIDVTDTEAMAKALDELDPEEFVRVADEMAGLHAALCSDTPSKAQILAVPMRRRMLFFNWLQSEVMNPEAATPGGNAQVASLPRRLGA